MNENINVFNQMCSTQDIEKSMEINEKLLKIVHEVCKIFNREFKNKYLAHYFLFYDTYEILIYSLTDDKFYKAIVRKETTKEQLLKGLYCVVGGGMDE